MLSEQLQSQVNDALGRDFYFALFRWIANRRKRSTASTREKALAAGQSINLDLSGSLSTGGSDCQLEQLQAEFESTTDVG